MSENRSLYPGMKDSIIIFIKGALIGIANIIPGVSGGTFALILGIYERILTALHNFNLDAVKKLLNILKSPFSKQSREDLKQLCIDLDVFFLGSLGLGAGAVIIALSFLIDWLLVVHPAVTLSFFIGLIIPSMAVPWRMMGSERKFASLVWILPGIALTVAVSFAFGHVSLDENSLLWSFLTGSIAISAMILPGISGSFVMLVMGQYQNILKKLQIISSSIDVGAYIWLGSFALGCVVGLLVFARFLNFLLKRYRAATLAFLIGLIIGSFWVLWPFKDYSKQMDLTHISAEFRERVAQKQDIRVATAPNQLPTSFSEVLYNLISLGLGLAGAFAMNRLGGSEEFS